MTDFVAVINHNVYLIFGISAYDSHMGREAHRSRISDLGEEQQTMDWRDVSMTKSISEDVGNIPSTHMMATNHF